MVKKSIVDLATSAALVAAGALPLLLALPPFVLIADAALENRKEQPTTRRNGRKVTLNLFFGRVWRVEAGRAAVVEMPLSAAFIVVCRR
jgi:hypothetical protein